VVEAVPPCEGNAGRIDSLKTLSTSQLKKSAADMRVSLELVLLTKKVRRLSCGEFAAGGIATPADRL